MADLVFVVMLLLGAWAYFAMPRVQYPEVELNWVAVAVAVIWSGAGAQDVEREIAVPLEAAVRRVPESAGGRNVPDFVAALRPVLMAEAAESIDVQVLSADLPMLPNLSLRLSGAPMERLAAAAADLHRALEKQPGCNIDTLYGCVALSGVAAIPCCGDRWPPASSVACRGDAAHPVRHTVDAWLAHAAASAGGTRVLANPPYANSAMS